MGRLVRQASPALDIDGTLEYMQQLLAKFQELETLLEGNKYKQLVSNVCGAYEDFLHEKSEEEQEDDNNQALIKSLGNLQDAEWDWDKLMDREMKVYQAVDTLNYTIGVLQEMKGQSLE